MRAGKKETTEVVLNYAACTWSRRRGEKKRRQKPCSVARLVHGVESALDVVRVPGGDELVELL